MEIEFFNYFTKIDNIVSIFEFVFFGVLSIALFKKSGNVKYLESLLEKFLKNGGSEVKYRTQDYQEKEKVKGQDFDKFIKTYRVNKVTGELEETGEKIDIQEMINSSLSTCMTEVLSKFFPDNVPVDDEKVAFVEEMRDDLDYLQETFQVAEKYREILNLSDTASVQDIFAEMKKQNVALTESLNKNEKKEILGNDEKEIDEKSK